MAHPRTHNNEPDGNPINFMDHVAKAKNRGRSILGWLSSKKYNKNENHIMIDFETVGTGIHKTKAKKPRDVISHHTQEPFELGLSVRDRDGNWRHRAFLFTPPNLNRDTRLNQPNANGTTKDGKPFFANPEAFHKAATQFHTTKQNKDGSYLEGSWKPGMEPNTSGDPKENGRHEELHEATQPYTYEAMGGKSEHETQPIPWDEIDEWLKGHGVSRDKKTNFIAHNSPFDIPILERMINLGENGNLATKRHGDETGKTKGRSSLLGSLYNAVNDSNGKEPTFRWATDEELSEMPYHAKSPWKGGYLNEGIYKKRDVGDGFRQDTLVEFMRLLGDNHGETDNTNKLVLRKAAKTGAKKLLNKKWYHVVYSKSKEKAHGSGIAGGTSLDDIRASFQAHAFEEGTEDNAARKLFESIKNGMESEEEDHEFFKDLKLTKTIKKEMSNNKKYTAIVGNDGTTTYKARDYFRAFNAVAAHSGAADTAFVTTMLFPFMEDFMDVFDHEKYTPINTAGEFVEGQGKAFSDAFMKFHNNWGQMLGSYPAGGSSADEPRTLTVLRHGTFTNPALAGIVNNLNNKNAWFNKDGTRRINEDGSDLNPLLHEGSRIITPRQTTLSEAQQAEQERIQSIYRAEWDKFKVGKKEEGKTEDETKAAFTEYWEENRDALLGTPNPSKKEAGKPDLSGQNDPVIQQTISEGLRPKASDFKGFEDRITGPITVRKWQGYDGRGERIVVSIPIDNTRVTFSESEWDGFTYKPLLGAAQVAETPEGKGSEVGVRDYSTHLFADFVMRSGERFPAPEGALGAEIERVLKEYHGKLQQYVEPHSVLDHRALNEWINTPASSWLTQSLSLTPFQKADIRNYGMENVGNDPTGYKTNRKFVDWAHQVLEDAKANPDDPLKQAQKALLFNAPHLATRFTEFQENHDPVNALQSIIEKLGLNPESVATPILGAGDDPNLFSRDETGRTTINMDYLYNTFFSGQQIQDRDGNVIEGLHPQQFFFRTGRTIASPYGMNLLDQDVNLQDAFANYVEFAIRSGLAGRPISEALDSMEYTPLPLHDLNDPLPRQQLKDAATDPDLSQEENTAAANELGKDNEPITEDIKDQVSPEVKEEIDNKSTFEDAREESENQKDFSNRINKIIEDLKLNGSSFVTDNYINSLEGEASVNAAYDALFPPRETAQTPDEVQDLLFDALDQYAGSDHYRTDSSTPDATTFARELEWIRINHLDTFSQEELAEALNSNDTQSLAGQWLDLFNYAATAMGEFAGEGLALVEEEKAQMGDRFMGNAHRQFLHHSYDPNDPQNWDEDSVQEKTQSIREHFATEPEVTERRSWRDRAKAMAIGTAKAPIEALKWYTSWNDLSQQVKDATSGRSTIGRKLVQAARDGKDPYSVNIGTPEQPRRVASEAELQYYTENIPVSGARQPSLIRQFLVGKKTYGDVQTEIDEATPQDNVRSFVNKVKDFQEGAVRLRTVPATTPEQTEFGAEQYENVSGQQAHYENRIKNVATEIRDRDPEQGIFLPDNSYYNPPINKSLDKLRDYLLRV